MSTSEGALESSFLVATHNAAPPTAVLVCVPTYSGLSSVAAMFALNMVAGSITQGAGGAGGGVTRDVVVLCTRQHSDSHPPTLAPGMDNTHPYMRHVKIRCGGCGKGQITQHEQWGPVLSTQLKIVTVMVCNGASTPV